MHLKKCSHFLRELLASEQIVSMTYVLLAKQESCDSSQAWHSVWLAALPVALLAAFCLSQLYLQNAMPLVYPLKLQESI